METNKVSRPFIPGLIINVTDSCTFDCKYCPPCGENLSKGTIVYDEKAVVSLISLAKKHGVQQIRFTGGEPLCEPERLNFFLHECGNSFKRIVVNTNGSLLHDNFDWLEAYRNQIILKVSFDTLDEAAFNAITQRKLFNKVYSNLQSAIQRKYRIEVNCVLYEQSFKEIVNIIDFAINNNIDLKILTASTYYGFIDPAKNAMEKAKLVEYLLSLSCQFAEERLVGERGAPMLVYRVSTSKITVFDSATSNCLTPLKCYFTRCETECSQYPCDYGAFSMGVSTDGLFSICRGRKDWGEMVFNGSSDEIEKIFLRQQKQFQSCFEMNVNKL